MQNDVTYRETLAPAELRRFVMRFWEFSVKQSTSRTFVHHIPPDGCVSLANPGPGILTLVGPRLEALRIDAYPGLTVRGVRFWPGVTSAILGVSGFALRDVFDRAASVLPALPAGIKELEIEALSFEDFVDTATKALLVVREHARNTDRIIAQSVAEVIAKDGDVVISELAHSHNLSERQLQRRFREEVGVTPKQFARIRRFRSSVADMIERGGKGWAAVAYEHGYSDQAHLCREYARLAGMSPEDLKSRIGEFKLVDVKP